MTRPRNTLATDASIVCELTDHTLVRISGDDRQKFLHGQLSVHMEKLDPARHQRGVACTPKGRMYSSFRILNRGDDYLLALPSSIVEHSLTTLKKYAVFFKTTLEVVESARIFGISGQAAPSALTELCAQLPVNGEAVQTEGDAWLLNTGGRFEFWCVNEQAEAIRQTLSASLPTTSADFWTLLDIEAVQPSLNEHTLEKYIPQDLNQPSIGAVSFRKGCFTGQEIITRMQTLGTAKRHCYHLRAFQPLTLNIGRPLFDAQGKAVGESVEEAINASDQLDLLAVVKVDAVQSGQLFLDEQQLEPVEIFALPYLIDPKIELQR